MRLSKLIMLYTKARIYSWLTNDTQTAWAVTTEMQRIQLASFHNGRMITITPANLVPDSIPPGWGQQSPGDPE